MTTHLRATNPDSIEMTLTVTMTLKEWKELREHVENTVFGPAAMLRHDIQSMVAQAAKHFCPETPQ